MKCNPQHLLRGHFKDKHFTWLWWLLRKPCSLPLRRTMEPLDSKFSCSPTGVEIPPSRAAAATTQQAHFSYEAANLETKRYIWVTEYTPILSELFCILGAEDCFVDPCFTYMVAFSVIASCQVARLSVDDSTSHRHIHYPFVDRFAPGVCERITVIKLIIRRSKKGYGANNHSLGIVLHPGSGRLLRRPMLYISGSSLIHCSVLTLYQIGI